MPLGLWKSRVEIYREENDRRHAEWREQMDRRDADWRAYCAKSDERHDQLMANHQETVAAFKIVIEELRGIRRELNDLTDAVAANTEAILRLIDRFDQWEGRPPGPPDLRSV